MTTTQPAEKPRRTRHRIEEVPGRTTPAGTPSKAPTPKKPAASTARKAPPKNPPKRRRPAPATKGETVVAMLSRPEGATMDQLRAATKWQAHSVRGFFAGTLKRKKGLTIVSKKVDGVRVYRAAGAINEEAI